MISWEVFPELLDNSRELAIVPLTRSSNTCLSISSTIHYSTWLVTLSPISPTLIPKPLATATPIQPAPPKAASNWAKPPWQPPHNHLDYNFHFHFCFSHLSHRSLSIEKEKQSQKFCPHHYSKETPIDIGHFSFYRN